MPTVRDLTQLEFPAAKALVRQTMTAHTNARNSDKELMWRIWVGHQKLIIQDLEEFFKGLPAETITRCRREIQNEDCDLLPTLSGVLTQRRIKEAAIREYYGQHSTEYQRYLGFKYEVSDVKGTKKGLLQ